MQEIFYVLLGLATGILSGALGIGGGILLIPALIWFGWVEDQRNASGITLAVLTVPVVLPAVLQYYRHGYLTGRELTIAGWIGGGFLVGAWLGGDLVPHIPMATLRLLFGLALIFVAVRFILASSPEADAVVAGLIAVSGAWLVWFALRLVGIKHFALPRLATKIEENYRPPNEFSEYQI